MADEPVRAPEADDTDESRCTDDPAGDWTAPGAFEVAPDLFRIPLPLPTDGLRAVNVYALRDGDGLVLVDSGWALQEAREALEKALAALGAGVGDVRRFLVTHIHRDHYTLAVAIRRELGTRVSLGIGEQPSLRRIAKPDAEAWSGLAGQLRRGGAAALLRELLALPAGHDPGIFEPPDDWIEAPVEVPLATGALHAVATPGHTRGHVVFVDPARDVLLAGDHVLPHITPSIGFEAAPPESPLGDYLASLRLVRSLPDRRLLPAHGPVASSVHARIDELLTHHATRLDEAFEAVGAGAATAYEAAARLRWTRRRRAFADLDVLNRCLAVSETAAHLDLLAAQGRLHRSEVDGVRDYRVVAGPAASPAEPERTDR